MIDNYGLVVREHCVRGSSMADLRGIMCRSGKHLVSDDLVSEEDHLVSGSSIGISEGLYGGAGIIVTGDLEIF